MRSVVRDMIVVNIVELVVGAGCFVIGWTLTAVLLFAVGPVLLWLLYLLHPGGLRVDLWVRRTGIHLD